MATFERPYQDGKRPFTRIKLNQMPIITDSGKIDFNFVERITSLLDQDGFVTKTVNKTIKGESKSFEK